MYMEFVPETVPGGQVRCLIFPFLPGINLMPICDTCQLLVPQVQAQPWQQQWERGGSWQQEGNLPPAGSWQQQPDLGDPWQQALWPAEGPWHPGYQPPVQAGYPSVGGQPDYPAGYPVAEQGSFPAAGQQVGWQGQPPCSPEPPVFPAVYRYISHFQPLSCTLIPVATTVRGCTSNPFHAGSSTTPATPTTAALLSTQSQSHHQDHLCQPFHQPTQPTQLLPLLLPPPILLPLIRAWGR